VLGAQWKLSDIDGQAREGEDDGHQRCAFDFGLRLEAAFSSRPPIGTNT